MLIPYIDFLCLPDVVARGVMYLGCLCICACVYVSVHASRMLLTQYLEKYSTYFHQTFSIGTFLEQG